MTVAALLLAGRLATAASVCFVLLMQAVSGQWFPPPISISQYGVGPDGWIFSLWVVTLALAPVLLGFVLPAADRGVRLGRVLVLVGLVGSLVMAVVRTDPGGAQESVNAQIHTAGSVVGLVFLPFGMVALLWHRGPRWRRPSVTLLGVTAVGLILLLFAAGGADTAGLGPARSWAFWQTVAVVASSVHVIVLTIAVGGSGRGVPGDPLPDADGRVKV